jgi:hypothetical protein
MRWIDLSSSVSSVRGRWALVYSTVDAPIAAHATTLASRVRGPVFGCTSSAGVFTPRGFERGAFALIGEDGDADVEVQLRTCSAAQARRAAREAAQAIAAKLGRTPDALLLHATPGFEERLIEGLDDAFGGHAPPTFGGSAADDDLSGKWSVFEGAQTAREGFLLVGFKSEKPVLGSFVAGYVPGRQRGIVTRASGRVVMEIDHRPAARVYDEWLSGALQGALDEGRVVLADTTLHPVGRAIDRVGNVPRYLLSHPHEVRRDGALTFFTELAQGDEIVLMIGSAASLLERTDQVVQRAIGRTGAKPRGGVLVYCGGCVMAIGDRAKEVGTTYARAIGGAPFIGAATFGEVGCFTGPTPVNRHGNLMCDTVLFT